MDVIEHEREAAATAEPAGGVVANGLGQGLKIDGQPVVVEEEREDAGADADTDDGDQDDNNENGSDDKEETGGSSSGNSSSDDDEGEEDDEEGAVDDLVMAALAAGLDEMSAPTGALLDALPPSLREHVDGIVGDRTGPLLQILKEVEERCGGGGEDAIIVGKVEGLEGEEAAEEQEEEEKYDDDDDDESIPGLGLDLASDEDDEDGGGRRKKKGVGLRGPKTQNEVVEVIPPKEKEAEEEAEIDSLGLSETDDVVPCVLGKVKEVFGPVTQPCYRLHYRAGLLPAAAAPPPPSVAAGATEEDEGDGGSSGSNSTTMIAAEAANIPVKPGLEVGYVARVTDFIVPQSLTSKGTDASNVHDEEVGVEEQEYSDDEAEAAAKTARKRNKKVLGGMEEGGLLSVDPTAGAESAAAPVSAAAAGAPPL
eukprot:evm.model.NODE_17868_length_7477_cov_32.756989.2